MEMTPEEVRDMKMRRRAGQAYDRAMTNTPAAPMPAAPMPPASAARPKRSAMVEEAIQEMQDAKARKKIADMGYRKGGSVSKASRRADGIAERGKTRGKMV